MSRACKPPTVEARLRPVAPLKAAFDPSSRKVLAERFRRLGSTAEADVQEKAMAQAAGAPPHYTRVAFFFAG